MEIMYFSVYFKSKISSFKNGDSKKNYMFKYIHIY